MRSLGAISVQKIGSVNHIWFECSLSVGINGLLASLEIFVHLYVAADDSSSSLFDEYTAGFLNLAFANIQASDGFGIEFLSLGVWYQNIGG